MLDKLENERTAGLVKLRPPPVIPPGIVFVDVPVLVGMPPVLVKFKVPEPVLVPPLSILVLLPLEDVPEPMVRVLLPPIVVPPLNTSTPLLRVSPPE